MDKLSQACQSRNVSSQVHGHSIGSILNHPFTLDGPRSQPRKEDQKKDIKDSQLSKSWNGINGIVLLTLLPFLSFSTNYRKIPWSSWENRWFPLWNMPFLPRYSHRSVTAARVGEPFGEQLGEAASKQLQRRSTCRRGSWGYRIIHQSS